MCSSSPVAVTNAMTQPTATAAPSLQDADLTFRACAARNGSDPSGQSAPAPLVLVLPGGGYHMHAEHEGIVIADWLSSIGLNALVVRYPVTPHRHPNGLRRVQDVLVAARTGALELGIDTTRIGVIGFSAGGHLAALLSTASNTSTGSVKTAAEERIDLSILAYPVISMVNEPHIGSLTNLLGSEPTFEEQQALSAESLVSAQTPPTFLWHTADDGGVPVSHSLLYASALTAHNVPFELHVFERGEHGKGLAAGLGPLEAWTSLCQAWLDGHGWLPAPT